MGDRISHDRPPQLLTLSNGHGEDQIALRLLRALHQLRPELQVEVLPLVGRGEAFRDPALASWLHCSDLTRPLPSGGFSNQSLNGLLRDLAAGVLQLTGRQWRRVRSLGRRGVPILAVGDLLPLALAWSSGAPYAFLGTPKSDYTWRSGPGRALMADAYHRCKGSEWDPWEWTLMAHGRCRLVAVRDGLTARGLRRHGVPALAPGNPMMDGLQADAGTADLQGEPVDAAMRTIVLLPGSRLPEALGNAARLIDGLPRRRDGPLWEVLLPTGSRPAAAELAPLLEAADFRRINGAEAAYRGADASWRRGRIRLHIGRGRFSAWAGRGELGLATAGTATEQLVGLGIPALSLPGAGPQFTAAFARRQSRLLGGAVACCSSSTELKERMETLLDQPHRRRQLALIGRRRMGRPGGSARFAALLEERLIQPPAPMMNGS
ncbi:sugar synthetase [Synechococcus sp. RSCCF101]|uniref:lipid-A-disaccharide synthase-related protein n=1 Tax=Synechococcus sp. RSCCF101 TaxID=2511069 RepID=UPI0012492256|nr:lipid-A-disaccharide synthase-related protein [Synechococcus sp. RSCCF101]QEY32144.1 sugar synthetase [Synechococcus sp. RSCCF101]